MSDINAVGLLDEAAGYADMEGEHEFADKLRKAGTDVHRLVHTSRELADCVVASSHKTKQKALANMLDALRKMESGNG